MPRVTFTDPEIGAVGLTEKQARDAGSTCGPASTPDPASTRGWIHKAGNEGFIKLVADTERGVLVGATSPARPAARCSARSRSRCTREVPVHTLRQMIYAYPTFHRAIEDALQQLEVWAHCRHERAAASESCPRCTCAATNGARSGHERTGMSERQRAGTRQLIVRIGLAGMAAVHLWWGLWAYAAPPPLLHHVPRPRAALDRRLPAVQRAPRSSHLGRDLPHPRRSCWRCPRCATAAPSPAWRWPARSSSTRCTWRSTPPTATSLTDPAWPAGLTPLVLGVLLPVALWVAAPQD